MKGEWRPLVPEDLVGQDIVTHQSGVTIRVFVSPFDVPEGVRGYYDDSAHVFRIEFKYPFDEELVPQAKAPDNLRLFVGKNSGRLKQIEVDVDALGAEVLLVHVVPNLVDQAIEELSKSPPARVRHANYDLTRKVISNHRRELFDDLALAR